MSIQFEEEKEQLKADSEKLVLDKSCNNCLKKIPLLPCPIFTVMHYIDGGKGNSLNYSCSLHERKE